MLELAILIPFVLWSINEVGRGRAKNEEQSLAIKDLAHSINNVAAALQFHIEASAIRQENVNDIVDKIWHKLE